MQELGINNIFLFYLPTIILKYKKKNIFCRLIEEEKNLWLQGVLYNFSHSTTLIYFLDLSKSIAKAGKLRFLFSLTTVFNFKKINKKIK